MNMVELTAPTSSAPAEETEQGTPVEASFSSPSVADVGCNENVDGSASLEHTRHGADDLISPFCQYGRVLSEVQEVHVDEEGMAVPGSLQ